jgi:hypothetical protein
MYRMHWHHPTATKTTLPFIYSFTIDAFGKVKMILQLWQSYIPSVVLSLRLPRDFHIGSNNHNVQNALTSSYCNQNYTAIHLFFHNWRFWTHQNECIALTNMHSFRCVKPSTHAGLTLRLIAHNVQNALTSSYCSQNYTAIHLFFHNWRFWTHQNGCIALSTMHSFCCVKRSTHMGLPHWL